MPIALTVTCVVPLFLIETVWIADVELTSVDGKVTLRGLNCKDIEPVAGARRIRKSGGAVASCGWNGAPIPGPRAKREVVFNVGLFARFKRAIVVLVGAGPLAGVVRAKRLPHGVESPAVPPPELMQTERISAKLMISAVGTVMPGGTFKPGVVPVVELTNSEATLKAAARSDASVVADPTAEGELMNEARAETAATVVSSLIETKVLGVSEEHGPTTAIMDRLGLL
jgi:hypothetical protein